MTPSPDITSRSKALMALAATITEDAELLASVCRLCLDCYEIEKEGKPETAILLMDHLEASIPAYLRSYRRTPENAQQILTPTEWVNVPGSDWLVLKKKKPVKAATKKKRK